MPADIPHAALEARSELRSALGTDAYLLLPDEAPANLLGVEVLEAIAGQILGLFVAGAAAGVQGRAEQWSGEAVDWLRERLRAVLRRDSTDSIRVEQTDDGVEAGLRVLSAADETAVRQFAEMSETVTAAVLKHEGMTARRAAAVAARARAASLTALGFA